MYKAKSEDKGVGRSFSKCFEKTLRRFIKKIRLYLEDDFTDEDRHEFNHVRHWWICKTSSDIDKVRDHCYFTGEYRKAAHSICNRQFK